ncbi:MAG: phosphoribosylglycinamide formyltransferase [Bacteroidales bacterium]|nr:phosphoribosylglycinamide formyltransferase [Bacteroidales bacterium]
MFKIAIFASGSGSNAENIIKYFKNNPNVSVELVITNNKNAYVLQRAKKMGVEAFIISKDELHNSDKVLEILKNKEINFIVLAGFLLLIPLNVITEFQNRIVNIHPALLPKYGGKGMYGDNVHKAVVLNKESKSGITIHFVNEKYDEGAIVFQAECSLTETDSFEDVAKKVHSLEYEYYPKIIEEILSKIN